MKTSHITVQSLKSLIALAERKEQLAKEVAKIEAKLAALMGGAPASGAASKKGRKKAAKKAAKKTGKKPAKKAARKAKRGKRGSVSKKILTALEAAGPKGAKVADLSKATGIKNANIHAWIAVTGKKRVKRVGRGQYALAK